MHTWASSVFCLFLAGQFVFAGDVSYDETTRITGGSVVGMMKVASVFSKDARKLDQPMTTTILIKGNRMARVSQDHTEITDLDAETITHIDKLKREFSVVTFAQMKQAMEQALEKAKSKPVAKTDGGAATQTNKQDPNANVDVSFDAHARPTGATKRIAGVDANEMILTLAMNGKDKTSGQEGALAITNDMWMAPDLPGYEEVRNFNEKFAKKMGSVMSSGTDFSKLTQQVAASDAMKALGKEMSQVKGVPVLQVMRMGVTANGQPLPAASEAPLPEKSSMTGNDAGSDVTKSAAQEAAAQETSSRVRGAVGSSLGSAIGGLGGFSGFGKKKKKDSGQDSSTNSSQNTSSASPASAQTAGVLLESTTEIGKFSREVDLAAMQVPAGYKQVEAPELKANR